jgi:iron complex outermembrane receptor protein
MKRVGWTAALLALLAPGSLAARQTPPDTAVSLPPVTVTVLRASLDLTRVPAAVSTVEATTAARGGAGLALDESLRLIPGLQVDNRYNYALGERVSIRGFGARSQFGVRGIKVVVDGIPATLPDGQTSLDHVDVGALGRVEVLRGAASSLYGNAAGGVIQLESAPPPAAPFRTEARAVAGSNGLLRLESRSGGQSGRLSYGLDLARMRYDGYREHSSSENLFAGARLGYRSERDELHLLLRFVDYDALNPGALSDSLLHVDRWRAFPNNVTQRTGKGGRQTQLGATWKRTLPGGDLELAAHALARQVDNPTPPQIIDLARKAGGARAVYHGSARLGERALGWTVGVEGELQRDDRTNHRNVGGERGDLSLDQFEEVLGLGAFAQLSLPLTEKLSALAGLRHDAFRFRATDRSLRPTDPDDSGSRTMQATSPSLGVVYRAGEGASLYANVSTAFQTPTTTELANRPDGAGGFNPELEPERTRSVEGGLRGLLARRLSYQLSIYHARVQNELIGFEVPAVPGRTFFRNAGSAVHRGLEAEATVQAPGDVALRVTYAYTDARFRRYRTASASFDGKRLPGIAPHRLEGSVAYRPAWGAAELWARALSDVPANDLNTAHSPGSLVLGARVAGSGIVVRGVEVAPFAGIDNLLGARYNAAVTINAAGGRFYEPAPGRTFHAGVRVGVGGER